MAVDNKKTETPKDLEMPSHDGQTLFDRLKAATASRKRAARAKENLEKELEVSVKTLKTATDTEQAARADFNAYMGAYRVKIVVFGASGIIGQHLRLVIPAGVAEIIWVRRVADLMHAGCDLTDDAAREAFLAEHGPDVIINLAGESRTDVVERDPDSHRRLNSIIPGELARWCQRRGKHYVHVSTQAVFSGDHPPYHAESPLLAVNEYGRQKIAAEQSVRQCGSGWTIVRPTFVLGIRPMPLVGRRNPMEAILTETEQIQVADRWFSPAFATDVAAEIWRVATGPAQIRAMNIGIPMRVSRCTLAGMAGAKDVHAVSHDDFKGLAPRPMDTTYAGDLLNSAYAPKWEISRCRREFESLQRLGIDQRARELSIFSGIPEEWCSSRLREGFHALHAAIADDFRAANPKDAAELIEWYRKTDGYIWELSAYHCDAGVPAPGWNYSGMCAGVIERLKAAGAVRVLCLGDGIGDLTLSMAIAGLDPVYHDLTGSRTAAFARMRFWMYFDGEIEELTTNGWEPNLGEVQFDAIVSFDFLEHVTDVPAWATAIKRALRPGGLFFAQNAFACGSGPDGSIPMHLAENDRFEKDWDPMLAELGMGQLSSNWYQRDAVLAAA